MGQRSYSPILGGVHRGLVCLFNRVVLGASGAVSSQDSARDAGFVVAKTATKVGRYTLTFDKNYNRVEFIDARVIGADDAAYTTAKGIDFFLRDDDVGRGAGDGTIEIQFTRTDTEADAEIEDSREILIMAWVRDASL